MTERKAISKRTRFEVFKRDGFKCQYCGAVPTYEIVLEVDHIEPVAAGGGNDEDNLITACFNCNRGKSDRSLSCAPESIADRASRIEESEAQLAGYREIINTKRERQEADAWTFIHALFGKCKSTTHERFNSCKQFLTRLPIDDVLEAADIARARRPYSEPQRFKYFCGICWNKIRSRDDG